MRDDGAEGRRWGMGVALVGSGAGGSRDMPDEGVCKKVSGNYCRVRHGYAYLMTVYRGGEDEGIQQVHTVAGPIYHPHKGGEIGRVKER